MLYYSFGRLFCFLAGVYSAVWVDLYGSYPIFSYEWFLGLVPIIFLLSYDLFPFIFKWVKQHIAQKDSDQSDGSHSDQDCS